MKYYYHAVCHPHVFCLMYCLFCNLHLYSSIYIAEGCWRQSVPDSPPEPLSTRRSATTPAAVDPPEGGEMEGTAPSHRLTCSPAEERDIRCLNEGQCYVLALHGDYRTLPQCRWVLEAIRHTLVELLPMHKNICILCIKYLTKNYLTTRLYLRYIWR